MPPEFDVLGHAAPGYPGSRGRRARGFLRALSAPRLLIEGRPGVGKSTVADRLIAMLSEAGVPVSGFVTREVREGRRRTGFRIETVSGEEGILAHVGHRGGPRVGRYGVDVEAFERIALPTLEDIPAGNVLVIDELGKMELASERFRDAVEALFAADAPIVATVHMQRHPFTDALKRRDDVEVLRVTRTNRDSLPERIRAILTGPDA
jgi:nucleoside-triphosphatase